MKTTRDTRQFPLVENRTYVTAWLFGLAFYFFEYVIRSSPAVMIHQLSTTFHTNSFGVSAVLGSYYYPYAITSLIAGIMLDRYGAKYPVAVGLLMLAAGCVMFALPSMSIGYGGRFLQGAGSAFGFTGCVYLATHGFASRFTATAIGITQCVGMFGGSAGQFAVGKIISYGATVPVFWIAIGICCTVVCVALFLITPVEDKSAEQRSSFGAILNPYKIVFTNPQSYLSGLISGLLFAPTTVFVMTWGVAFFQQDRALNYDNAVLTCSMAPLGWVIGCPLLGWISDRINKRKPVLIAGILMMLVSFAQIVFIPSIFPVPASMLLFGISSGAAMIPYSIIKEANPPQVKGSATGAINFLTFSVTALIGPLFGHYLGKTLGISKDPLQHFQLMGVVIIAILFVALITSMIIRETGHSSREVTSPEQA